MAKARKPRQKLPTAHTEAGSGGKSPKGKKTKDVTNMNKTKKNCTDPQVDAGLLLGADGWQGVDVGDELLLGASQGGFMGLEVRPTAQAATFCWVHQKDVGRLRHILLFKLLLSAWPRQPGYWCPGCSVSGGKYCSTSAHKHVHDVANTGSGWQFCADTRNRQQHARSPCSATQACQAAKKAQA